ncbi:MAG: OpgC domain-containing protein [Alphaproteobacteria bacterium]|nr:OpgC domain-containing protein [Alphaproteobacteria bacterium]
MATAAAAAPRPTAASVPSERARDLRLDFFRGLGLILIFIDHVPDNPISNYTLISIAFCDATELFVFISGYTAALVFVGLARRAGTPFATAQVLRRCWTLYVAHIFLFVIFTAQVAWTVERLANPMFAEEMNVTGFLREPHIAVLQALSLQFQPTYMNILPLYILLMLGLAVSLAGLRWWKLLIVVGAVGPYVAVQLADLNLPTYPDGHWYFNPFAWQLLFNAGALLGVLFEVEKRDWSPPSWLVPAAAAFVVGASALRIAVNEGWLSGAAVQAIWQIADKTDMGPLRLLNFAALAIVAVALAPRDAAWVHAPWLRPIIVCGQNGLNVFCVGIFLTVIGHALVVEINPGLAPQILVTIVGTVAQIAVAYYLEWLKGRGRAAAAGGGGA